MGRSPAGFKVGSDQVDREVTPSNQKMRLRPPNSPTPAANNIKYGELGPATEHNMAAVGFVERDLEEECRAIAEVEQNKTERGRTIRKKSLEEIFSATRIICRSERCDKRVSRMTRSSWDNREPTSSSAICSGTDLNDSQIVNMNLLVMTSMKKHQDKSTFTGKLIIYLNTHQTEAWKGWMPLETSVIAKQDTNRCGYYPTVAKVCTWMTLPSPMQSSSDAGSVFAQCLSKLYGHLSVLFCVFMLVLLALLFCVSVMVDLKLQLSGAQETLNFDFSWAKP
ncbi:hypothetical protein Ancab_011230 [Ancistrocladus abbreviatus]